MRHRAVSAHRQTVAVCSRCLTCALLALPVRAAIIQASGMAYTFLRPNLFMQGLLNFLDDRDPKRLYAAIGDAKVSAVDVRDIADVAVAAD